jgi:hypothetical protein
MEGSQGQCLVVIWKMLIVTEPSMTVGLLPRPRLVAGKFAPVALSLFIDPTLSLAVLALDRKVV